MDFVFDLLAEFVFEIIGEGYVSLCSAFVPQRAITEKGKKIIQGIVLVVSILLFVGLFIGIAILVEAKGQSFWGWLLISLSIIYLLTGIAVKIVSHIKKKN